MLIYLAAHTTKKVPYIAVRDFPKKAATYSPTWYSSTIGADGLNFPVRNGKGWARRHGHLSFKYFNFHTPMAHKNDIIMEQVPWKGTRIFIERGTGTYIT